MAKPSYFSLPPQILTQIYFLSRLFGFSKIGSKFTLFLNKVNEPYGMGNIFIRSLILTDIATK